MSKIDWPWLQKYIWPRSFRIWITGPKMWSAPTKTGMPYNFYFIKFSPVEAAEARQTLFRAPWPRGWGYGVATQLGTFLALRSISMPNFIKIVAVVWISIADIHAHTHWLLYIRFVVLSAGRDCRYFGRSQWDRFSSRFDQKNISFRRKVEFKK